ncbi:pitrilysin family protein [Sphingorhabdus sp. Alg239-R122]|uniref:M16 family metallopeptidase n=1 Tax=Sphingorhabdus sp. Alg239-R122 TaxID=2305989 RepID=UPI0013DB12CA|nr:pitrilysin family protein [Sphingorhabdus sp. Alg239-R122]
MNTRFSHKILSAVMVSAIALSAPAVYASEPAPVSELVAAVDIPHEEFKLDNGLTVIVHEDRKAPVVAVSIWYDVGSKHEPKGKTGYAHLFEHIMFNGSENAPGDYFKYTKQIGATDLNGTTWLDRTNYFQTVPKAALEAALFLESDRMGHLLDAIDQEKLDNQIGVVQNEKRQGDSQPYGLVSYRQLELGMPKGHPYAHSTIGSLEDLQAASLEDMKDWFRDHYGPNNAILVLAGDIDTVEAKPLVEKWFGDIPAGKKVQPVTAKVPVLEKPIVDVMKDKVANTRIYRTWAVPGMTDPEFTALNSGASVLGGLASSRLDNILVREEQSAVSVAAYVQPFVINSFFEVRVDVKPGEDVEAVSKRLDEIMADFIANGPTQDEVNRVATNTAAARIAGLEQVGGFGGKATALAQGKLFAGDSDYYKKELGRLASVTPQSISAAMKKWLSNPALEIRVVPGDREEYKEVGSGASGDVTGISMAGAPAQVTADGAKLGMPEPEYYFKPETAAAELALAEAASSAATPVLASAAAQAGTVDRSKFPEVGEIQNVDFPDVEETVLSNGVKVYFAKRDEIPVVRVAVKFDIGSAADPKERLGTHGMVVSMMDEGTTSLSSTEFAESQERLGANIGIGGGLDSTTVSVRAVEPNLAASLDLLADVIKNPAFDSKELERVRQQQMNAIAAESTRPISIALRNLPPLIYGETHPYGASFTGTGDPEVVASLTRDELVNFHSRWMRPEKAKIFVVGDTSLTDIKPMLEKRFGKWMPSGEAAPAKNIDAVIPEQKERIIVINQPNSPQSLIFAGQVLDKKGTDDIFDLQAANEILGGDFLSRINFNLRETKGWSYGSRTLLQRPDGQIPMLIFAAVQTNQTGPSVSEIIKDMTDFLGEKGVTGEELERTVNGGIRELPGSYERSAAVLGQIQRDENLGRDFGYVETLADRYRGLEAEALNAAMKEVLDVDAFTWVIVGDAAKIQEQIDALNMPTEYRGYDPKAQGGE